MQPLTPSGPRDAKIAGCYLSECQPLEPGARLRLVRGPRPALEAPEPGDRRRPGRARFPALRPPVAGLRALDAGSSRAIGSVWTAVILSIVYFALGRPDRLGMRLLGKDPLDRALRARALVLAAPRAEPARAPGRRRGTSSDADATSSASPASTTTPPPPCSATARWSPPCQEERFTPQAHDSGFPEPRGQVRACRRPASGPSDLDAVGFYDKPLLKFERMLIDLRRDLPALLRLVPQGDARSGSRRSSGCRRSSARSCGPTRARSCSPSTT